jgi:asparagine N-glycosylation enzyme membrane subunit Stt3
MKSVYNFVVTPIGQRYNNVKKVGDKELIVNTEIFNHQHVNRRAKVLSTPIIGDTNIEINDDVILHHNVFRRWHNVHGEEKNSKNYFNENTYIVYPDQIFLYKRFWKWHSPKGFCWVKPIKNQDKYSNNETQENVGIVKYTDGTFKVNDLVGFTPISNYEFVIDGELLYRVYTKFITIKYEYQGNEEAYNPSWAQSS